MQKKLGTNAISSLNVAKGPHLIEDHELRESYNGWTDEDGVWRSAPGPTLMYSGYDAISCLAAGRMAGVDHVVWLDGNTLYDNGTNVGTITAGTTMDIVALDDSFLILGAAKNYIWDGTHLREQGTWQPDYVYSINETATGSTAGAPTITAISLASPCQITLNSNPYHAGDRIYVTGIVGTTELNGRYFTVTASTNGAGGKITISEDSSGYVAWSSGGTVNGQCDLVGDYKWYYTQTIELSGGRILESAPRGLKIGTNIYTPTTEYNLGPTDSYDASVVTLSAGKYVISGQGHGSPLAYARFYFVVSGVPLFSISGTAGVDYKRGINIYRTKADGVDFYLERSYLEDDADLSTFTDGTSSGLELPFMLLGIPDNELGAVYVPGLMDHGNAPQSDVGALAGQRVLLASGSDIYWSSLDGIEYYNNGTGFTPLGDVVTAIAPFRDGWAVFSCDRLWYVQIPDGLPSIVEINTPVGTVWPKAMTTTDAGVLFLRPDGLWLFDGARVSKISRRAFASILEPASVVQAGEVLYVSGSEKSYIAQTRDNGWEWHESEHYRPFADSTNGEIYAADLFHVEQLFTGRRAGGRLSTKHYGDGSQNKATRAVLDIEGDTVPTVWLNGNRQSDYIGHVDESPTTDRLRRRVWVSIPRYNNQYVYLTLETTGDIKVYGIEFECAG